MGRDGKGDDREPWGRQMVERDDVVERYDGEGGGARGFSAVACLFVFAAVSTKRGSRPRALRSWSAGERGGRGRARLSLLCVALREEEEWSR